MSKIISLNLSAPESGPHILLLLEYNPDIKQFNPGIPYNIFDHQDDLISNAEPITLNLNYILLSFKKPAASRREHKQSSEAAYYAVIEQTVLGQGSYGSVRAVIGTWKIEHGKAVFKVKANQNKSRLLKTLFVTQTIAEIICDQQPKQPITPSLYQLYYDHAIKQLKKDLMHEQKAGSHTPHLSTKYPVIETAEGMHLLMRKQPGCDLETVILDVQKNPSTMSVIQRLLLCLALYESLEREVHAIASTSTGGLIHRDIKPANIMLSINDSVFELHIIDYGMCTDDSQKKAQLCGTPRYLDPQVYHAEALPSAANDLFATAIICTEVWGETHRKTIEIQDFIYENQNIQFAGLFDKIACSTELSDQLRTLFTATTRFNPSERLAKEQVINEYTQMLLSEFGKINSNIPELNQRILALRERLNDYYNLSSAERIELHKEFVAADYLAHNPVAFTQPAPPNKPLSVLWNAYYLNLIKQIQTAQLPVNSPVILLNHSAKIKTSLTRLLIPLTPQTVKQLSSCWSALIESSQLFERIRFLMPQIDGLNMLFEQELDELCRATVSVDAMSDCTLRDEWTMLLRLLSLYAILVELNYADSLVLVTAWASTHTLAAAYDSLYDVYHQHITNQLQQAIEDENKLVIYSPCFFESKASSLPIHSLLADIKRIFQENKNQPHEIQRKMYNVTVTAMCALHTLSAANGSSPAQTKVIDSLCFFKENLLANTMKQSFFANSTLARL